MRDDVESGDAIHGPIRCLDMIVDIFAKKIAVQFQKLVREIGLYGPIRVEIVESNVLSTCDLEAVRIWS